MKTEFNGDVHYGLAIELDEMYDSFILNSYTPEQARANAIALLQNRISVYSRKWEDAKVNEQMQLEANTGPIKNYDKEEIDSCILPPYSVIQEANRRSKKYPANMPVSDDPTFIFRH